MKSDKYRYAKGHQQQQIDNTLLSQINSSVVVLRYIEPPRDLLKCNNKMNCAFKKQLNPLPYIFKYCEKLHPLGQNINTPDFIYDPDLTKNIYRRDLELKINPFQTKNYFKSIANTDFRKITRRETIVSQKDQLRFDSHFQSGNLLSVDKQITNHNYHLMMQNDINTYGCTQWFFYQVNNKDPIKATFFINNFYKAQSLYQKGMKILIFSMKKFVNEGVGWVRGGEQIAYFPNKMTQKKENGSIAKQFFSLKFVYNFQYQNDEVYFAYNYPYTYSRLNNYLIQKEKKQNSYFNCRTLCKTSAQNKIFLVTITNNAIPKSNKNSIFLTSRVHPGQTVSSLMMEGIIDFLTSDDKIANILRDKFIFKITPMLNPDGVIHGNYRTNLAGIDLNRVWDSTDKYLSPEIYQLKKHITQFNKQCPIIMFCDLHGHSARKSAFIYGCQNQKLKFLGESQQSRLFPFMLSFLNEDFRYKSCKFTVQKSKKGTARVQLWKQLKIPNIFTLQASFCSAQNSQYHFRPTDYSQIGVSFCKAIYEYFINMQKRKQYRQKLRNNTQYGFNKKSSSDDDDSQSDNDLLDKKTLNQLKNGTVDNIWNKRKLIIQKPLLSTIVTEQLKQRKSYSRRYTSQKKKNTIKTQGTPQPFVNIVSLQSKKTLVASIPTKRITLQTEPVKATEPKGYLKYSIIKKSQQNYRGKSSIYRIQRKILKTTILQPHNKRSYIFEMDNNSLDLS